MRAPAKFFASQQRGELGNTSVKTLDIILASLGLEIEFKTIRGFGLPSLDELS